MSKFYYSNKTSDRIAWLSKVMDETKKNKITIIQGLRRIGKSLIMNTITRSDEFSSYDKRGFDAKDFGINPDEETIKIIDLVSSNKNKSYLILIDEFQELEDWHKFFWTLHKKENVKVLATGSVSANLNAVNVTEGGRFVYIQIPPLSFEEYISINKDNLFGNNMNEKFNKYATMGSYPDQEFSEDLYFYRKQVKENIYEKVKHSALLEKAKIENSHNINKVIMYLIENLGNTVNINSISNELSINSRTTEKIIKYLKATFIIYEINNIITGKGKAATYNRKFYLSDHSFYLFLYQSPYKNLKEKYRSFLFENIVINQVKSTFDRYAIDIRFFKSKEYDIDLVITNKDKKVYFEIKDSESIASLSKSQKAFATKYKLNIIYLGETKKINNIQYINHLQFYKEVEKWI